MKEVIKVGMADLQFAGAPATLRTSGLGSCVGIIMYDETMQYGGMAHIMLPDSSAAREQKVNRAKYADTACSDLYSHLLAEGCPKYRLKAKMAGGAEMFQFSSGSSAARIGPRNVDAVKRALAELRVPVLFEDTGGNSGRTIEFAPADGSLEIRTVNKGVVKV
ncbi:chemotaxis protein CheD [Alkalicoccus urumqiensis]|uniref:Probable chemoreceptor glutamine deamidase CheD n=1 Tax=Alkalicoccus urumqiensis TaxID=1548213 RepID=A0A2P6MGA2_ALKUR|nr:chemotaxis protein CheD [Alkalicoccus urumqiensis]PRO65325.1 chemotaxis protein CheD [Alkalicoccus urumqiensis]